MNGRIEQNTKLANMNEHNRRVTMACSVMAYGICAVLFQGCIDVLYCYMASTRSHKGMSDACASGEFRRGIDLLPDEKRWHELNQK